MAVYATASLIPTSCQAHCSHYACITPERGPTASGGCRPWISTDAATSKRISYDIFFDYIGLQILGEVGSVFNCLS